MRRAREIIDGKLYMASHPAKWPEGKLDWMRENVDAVVVLAKREDPELDQLMADGALTYWHCPVVDSHKDIAPEIPEQVVPWVVQAIRGGSRVLVCCLAGRSRSGITCGLVLRELEDLTGEEAIEKLRERRPGAIKREGPEAWLRALPRPSEQT